MQQMISANTIALQKSVAAIVLLGGLLILFSVLLVFYWLYYDNTPPFTSNIVYTMDADGRPTTTFRAGDTMLVYRDLCFTRDTAITMGRSLRRLGPNPLNVHINMTTGLAKAGCVNNANVLQIPPTTPPGDYEFVNVAKFSTNPLNELSVVLPPVTIHIVK